MPTEESRKKKEKKEKKEKRGRNNELSTNWEKLRASLRGDLTKKQGRSKKTSQRQSINNTVRGSLTHVLALDCEMVGIGVGGAVSVLGRVSIVNANGLVVYDSYVSSSPHRVTDFRTQYSGIEKHHLKGAPSKRSVQDRVRRMISSRIILGHALHNDLEVLELSHPESHIRDSSKYPPFMRELPCGKLKPRALRDVVRDELGKEIQAGMAGHDSVEDARSVLELYRKHRKRWEKYMAVKHRTK
jgi:hypothetical protein